MKSFVLSVILVSIAVAAAQSQQDEAGTTDSFLVLPTEPTTLQPSSREDWEEDPAIVLKNDFGVPEHNAPNPNGQPTPSAVFIRTPGTVKTTTTTQQAPDAVAAPTEAAPAPPAEPEVYKPQEPEIYSFHIESNIRYRYSRTYITSRVVNRDTKRGSEIRFRVVLPETAFISKFLMEIDGKTYESYVKEKEEAKRVYTEAQSQGHSAGLVELNTRNTNVFDVNVNIRAGSKVNFNLTYEELLQRRLGKYEQSINISPEQITNVKDFQILVNIEESQNITLLRVPAIIGNDVDAMAQVEDEEGNNADAVVERPAGNQARITWKPSDRQQEALDKQQLTGKFIVQYDIRRELDAGQVLVMNGYFVHFFAPENLQPLRKHVVFVLDTSGSMWGRRIEQLKEAMTKILADLALDDFFNIITFASDVVVWSPEDKVPISPNSHWSPPGEVVQRQVLDPSKRQPYAASRENIEKAQRYISSLVASGGTNIHDSVIQALNLTNYIKQAREGAAKGKEAVNITTPAPVVPPVSILPQNVESLVIFLTDGEPTVGITNPANIQALIKLANANSSIPLFSLGFGDGADFPFLRKLSLQNYGFARKIYADADAALQLKGFYKEIASPLLSNVTFNYTSPEYSIENVTITKYATIFGGTEIAVAGKIVPKPLRNEPAPVQVDERPRTNIGPGDMPASEARSFTGVPAGETLIPIELPNYIDVEIGGFGRDGAVQFKNPEIFSTSPIVPWGVPFPPRPTVPPTPEDQFLERLWAYLTIRQLIEKDLAQDPQGNEIDDRPSSTTIAPTPTTGRPPVVLTTIVQPGPPGSLPVIIVRNVSLPVPETPKQRALRLALKYGFVTSLTSLVVVKPNSTDVTDTKSADPSLAPAASAAASGHFAGPKVFQKYSGLLLTPPAGNSWANYNSQGGSGAAKKSQSPYPYGHGWGNYNHAIGSKKSQKAKKKAAAAKRKNKPASSTGNRISVQSFAAHIPLSGYPQAHPQAMAPQRIVGFGQPPANPMNLGFGGPPPQPLLPVYFSTTVPQYVPPVTATSVTPSGSGDGHPAPTTAFIRPHTPVLAPPAGATAAPAVPPKYPTTTDAGVDQDEEETLTLVPGPYSLKDVTWYSDKALVVVNLTDYKVAAEGDKLPAPQQYPNCTIVYEDPNKAPAAGRCLHLKDCIRADFKEDFTVYSRSYFCPLSSRNVLYAGACCAVKEKNRSDIRSGTRTMATEDDSLEDLLALSNSWHKNKKP